MALIDDEFESDVGVITLENISDQIVGSVQNEFDSEKPDIVSEEANAFIVRGLLPIDKVNRELGLDLYVPDVNTLSGLLFSRMNRLLKAGYQVRLLGALAEVVEEEGGRPGFVSISPIATKAGISLPNSARDNTPSDIISQNPTGLKRMRYDMAV